MLVAFATMFFACSESSDIWNNTDQDLEVRNKYKEPVTVTVPFKMKAIGEYQPYGERCPGAFNVIVDGYGDATHLGEFTVHFDFCGVPNPDFTFSYGDPYPSDVTFIADNGDELYATISGTVIPGRTPDHPEFVTSYWQDEFFILGGTGRFEGATGQGWSDDYNSSEDPYSHHFWEGTITMVKGKRN